MASWFDLVGVQLTEMNPLLLHHLSVNVVHLSITLSMQRCCPSRWHLLEASGSPWLQLLKNDVVAPCINLTLVSALARVDVVEVCAALIPMELGASVSQVVLS